MEHCEAEVTVRVHEPRQRKMTFLSKHVPLPFIPPFGATMTVVAANDHVLLFVEHIAFTLGMADLQVGASVPSLERKGRKARPPPLKAAQVIATLTNAGFVVDHVTDDEPMRRRWTRPPKRGQT